MKEIIVVEGRDDTRRLKEVFGDIDTIETNGSAIDKETLDVIALAHERRGVIVLTDPDFPGEKIRQAIIQAVPTAQHAFLTVAEATPKGKGSLGVEHASKEALERAFSNVQKTVEKEDYERVSKSFLMRLGLIGLSQSANLRDTLSKKLGIGHVNGKQLEKRLNAFGYTPQHVLEALEGIGEVNDR